MPHKKSPDGYMSVTEVLGVIRKPFLEMWRGKHGNKECNRIQKESRLLGETFHNEVVRQFNGLGLQTKDVLITDMVGRFFREFVLPFKVEPVVMEPEEPFIDHDIKLQGTFDAVIRIKGSSTLIMADWKTSNMLDRVTVPLQLSAYAHLWQYKGNEPIKNGVAVRVDKKTDQLDIIWYEDLGKWWGTFLNCHRVAQYVKSVK